MKPISHYSGFVLLLLVLISCNQKDSGKQFKAEKNAIDSTNTAMNVDSVINNFIKPIPIDSLRNLIDSDSGLSTNMKSVLDSLLNEIEKDSL